MYQLAPKLTSPSVSIGSSSIVSGLIMRTVTPGRGTPTQPSRRFCQFIVPTTRATG
jgi:hypothetical protein